MQEQLPPPSPENNFHGRLSEGMLYMMNFEAAMLGHKPPAYEGGFNENDAVLFAQEVEKHSELFEDLFTNPGLHPATAYPNLAPLVKTSLLTAPYLVMQQRKFDTRGASYKREFSEYNDSLRSAIRANPGMSRQALMAILKGGMLWAKLPGSYNRQSMADLNRVITGASNEFAAEQLLDWAAEHGTFTFEASSVIDDLQGIDFIVFHPDAKDPILIDIKSAPEQVQDIGIIDPTRPVHRIGLREHDISYKVALYAGVSNVLGKDKLRLDQSDIEQKGPAVAEAIQKIVNEINAMEAKEQPRLLAELVLKFSAS